MGEGPRIGLFGGSFDPIHLGHLILAQQALDFAGLARVVFLPTANPPHKTGRPLSPFDDRRRMVELAIAGNDRFEISLVEGGGDPTYTWQSILRFAAEGYTRERLHLLLGTDSLAEIGGWRRPEVIFEHATIIAMRRGTSQAVPEVPRGAAVIVIETGANSISASEIRRLAAAGRSIRYLVADTVERYIIESRLYAGGTGGAR